MRVRLRFERRSETETASKAGLWWEGTTLELATILHDAIQHGKFWTHSKMLVEGCTKISEGCANCWSESMARRFGGMVDESGEFDGTVKTHSARLAQVLPIATRKKPRVWTYWNDVFHRNCLNGFRDELFYVISHSTDFHIICTKRPDVAVEYFHKCNPRYQMPQKNVIILVTMENHLRMVQRRDAALQLSRFGWRVGILAEPLLGDIDLSYLAFTPTWVIAGAETGPKARVADVNWFRSLRDQATAAGTPFLLKHLNKRGRLLDEMEWNETP